ncbi:MAG TPA: hypothetical protein VEP91_09215 [Solirubrobacterales bacterium]|nr:hypothetical protein [Solirubrobacterales bacterium]
MSHRNQNPRLDLFSYTMAVAAGLFSAALLDALDIGGVAKYLIAFVLLTLTVGALLARSSSPVSRFEVPRFEPLWQRLENAEARSAETEIRIGGGGFLLTRKGLGLDLAEARSEESADRRPRLWIPSAEAPRRVSFRASGSSLVVGAEADEREVRVARVDFPQFRAVYVLLRDLEGERGGEATVPNLARDFVDQAIAVEWLAGVAELPDPDAEAIAASVAYSNSAGRRAWLLAAKELPADDPIRVAIAAAAE